MKKHIIITGNGRCGTTFLIRLLTRVGMDTGFSDSDKGVNANCNAGLEWDILNPKAPYVLKNPNLCSRLDSIVSSGKASIEHVIVPVRDLYQAAESRRDVQRRSVGLYPDRKSIPGGLWGCEDPKNQEAYLAAGFHHLLVAIAKWELPHTLLHFPRLVQEADYLYGKLAPLMNDVSRDHFARAFSEISKPSLVHHFERPK